jgi:hypothetical protein
MAGECDVAEVADHLVDVVEGFGDGLAGRGAGLAGGGLEAEPDPEETGGDPVEEFLAAVWASAAAAAREMPARPAARRVWVRSRITAMVKWPAAGRG